MARYRVLERGQTPDGVWHDPGEIIETNARKGKWMELLDPLDHDGDGEKGGSLKGEQSTARRGRKRLSED